MKFYLSSYKIGNSGKEFSEFFEQSKNKKIAYIPNAGDFSNRSRGIITRQKTPKAEDIQNLENLGLLVETLDLQKFFGNSENLSEYLSGFSGVWVSGGNTFILRQAFFLSGFDKWLQKNISSDFIYGAYSAGCCVLSPSFKGLQIVDDPENKPYSYKKTLWGGLGILKYAFLPHYDSDHHESADIDKEIEYAIENKIPFKAFRDGEVEIFEVK